MFRWSLRYRAISKCCHQATELKSQKSRGRVYVELCCVPNEIVKRSMINCFHLITLITFTDVCFAFCYLNDIVLSPLGVKALVGKQNAAIIESTRIINH